MPTQKTFKYQGEERIIMVRDDVDVAATLKDAKTEFEKGNFGDAARLLAISKYLTKRNVKFDLVPLEKPTMSFQEMAMKTCYIREFKDGSVPLCILFLRFSSKREDDEDSKTIYNVGFSHTKDVFSFLEVFD